ncbi:MAG: hypothetical protein SX243_06520 [Acidobacteriota bacterium]|nr:hypothetical protein [Acidobacteriota bacterium]
MYIYNVSYDLRKPGKNYSGLTNELKNSPDWWHYLGSTWLIATRETAGQLYNRLAQHLDKNDSVLVIRVSNDYSGWLTQEAWDWINKYFRQAA